MRPLVPDDGSSPPPLFRFSSSRPGRHLGFFSLVSQYISDNKAPPLFPLMVPGFPDGGAGRAGPGRGGGHSTILRHQDTL